MVNPMIKTLPCLSIRQPWVYAIFNLGKDIENRTWKTAVRGPVLIHAGKGLTRTDYDFFVDYVTNDTAKSILGPVTVPPMKALERGGIVGLVDIVDCVTDTPSPWFMGDVGFVLANPRPLPFTPYAGQLGFFRVPVSALSGPVPGLLAA